MSDGRDTGTFSMDTPKTLFLRLVCKVERGEGEKGVVRGSEEK